jgi:broad specificity phosphatase PhoE
MIVLMRHGKPEASAASLITGHQIGPFARQYNALGISKALPPPAATCAVAASAGCIVSSDLRRSIESVRQLAPGREVKIDPDLREAGLPEAIAIPLPLPPGVWVVIARVAWWLNIGRATESLAQARVRASRATDRLCAMADSHGSVLVVGHGMFNRLIAADLASRGWRGPRILPRAYWAAATFEF